MTITLSLEVLRTFIHDTLNHWKVPGAAVTIVHRGETVLCEGFGLRNIADGKPVTAQTLFPIASCTKAFTAMSLGLLVDEGLISWDTPVRTYMPAFKMHDVVASERITPRDLITHRSGLPRHDLIWYAANFSRQEVFDRLQHLELSKDMRATFQYNNIMFMVAGLLVTEVTGLSWERFVQARIFDVLGMGASTFSTIQARATADFASPYLERDGTVMEIPFYENDGENDAVGPAGNIVSCVADMARWLRVHTSGGAITPAGRALVAPATMRDMHTPQMVMRDELTSTHFDYRLSSYGLGWFLHAYKGQALSEHGGHLDGFSALTSVIPEARLGVVVLCNGDYTALPEVITHQIYDQLLGLPATDWNARLKPLWDEFRAGEKASQARATTTRRSEAQPAHALEAYAGEYEHAGYGVLAVCLNDAGTALTLTMNDKITLPLAHYHYEHFEAYWETFDFHQRLAFMTDGQGNIAHLVTQMEPEAGAITFVRRPERRLLDPAYLAQFVGDYTARGLPLAVSLTSDRKGQGALRLTFAGEPAQTLVPYRGTEFQLKDRPGFSVEFRLSADGQAEEAVIVQPGAVFTATRAAT